MASATVSTIWSASSTMMWRSGTRVIARRPWSGPPSRMMVPVMAMATRAVVTTASMRVELAAGSGRVGSAVDGDGAAAAGRRPRRGAGSRPGGDDDAVVRRAGRRRRRRQVGRRRRGGPGPCSRPAGRSAARDRFAARRRWRRSGCSRGAPAAGGRASRGERRPDPAEHGVAAAHWCARSWCGRSSTSRGRSAPAGRAGPGCASRRTAAAAGADLSFLPGDEPADGERLFGGGETFLVAHHPGGGLHRRVPAAGDGPVPVVVDGLARGARPAGSGCRSSPGRRRSRRRTARTRRAARSSGRRGRACR